MSLCVLKQRDAALWCDRQSLLKLLIVNQYSYHIGGVLIYHRINHEKIQYLSEASDFQLDFLESFVISQLLKRTSQRGLAIDHTVETAV